MPPITSYPTSYTAGFAGQIADQAPRYVRMALNKEAAPIPFGVAVKKGVNPGEALLPSLATDKPIGIAVFQHAQNQIGASAWAADAGIAAGDSFDLLAKGIAAVKVETAVTENDPVHVRYAGAGQKGAFRNAAVALETIGPVKGARFLTAAAAGGIAQVEFDALTALTT